MTFRQFTALATVAKHGNITKAAQAMRISQPSLSKQLKALEEDYRIRLFSRNGKGIQLTEDGAEFLMRIDPILAQLKNIEARYLNGSRVQEASPLRVGGTYGPSSNILPSLLAVYKKSHPDVAVTCGRIPMASFIIWFSTANWKLLSVPGRLSPAISTPSSTSL